MRHTILFIITAIIVSISAGDVETGLRLIAKGEFDEACEFINRAYRENPFSPVAQFAYARTLSDGKKAQELYLKVFRNEESSDSLKAESLYMLGCMQYCKEAYDKAIECFESVEKIVYGKKSRQVKARAALMKGEFRTPETVWAVSESDKTENTKKVYYFANTLYKQGKYKEALDYYEIAFKAKDKPWVAPALAGACLSAYHLGNGHYQRELYARLKTEYPASLEVKFLEKSVGAGLAINVSDIPARDDFGDIAKEEVSEETTPETKAVTPIYTLQIGAFSSAKNAKTMVQKIKNDFDDISIVEEMVHTKIFHKVRIGGFSTEDAAKAFGEKELKGKKISYRVVKIKSD